MIDKINHLSVSQVKMYSRCQLQWFFRYVRGLKVPPSSNLICGSATHAGLEDLYMAKMIEGNINKTQILDVTAQYVDSADEKEEVNWDKDRGQIKDQAVALVDTYLKSGTPDKIQQEEIEGVEKKISVTIQNKDISFDVIGYVDLELTNKIIDFKTIGRTPKVMDAADVFQCSLYAAAEKKEEIETHYLVKLKTPKIVIPEAPKNIPELIKLSTQIFMKTYISLESAMQSGNFIPTGITHPWACGMCGYGDRGLCPYFKFKQ